MDFSKIIYNAKLNRSWVRIRIVGNREYICRIDANLGSHILISTDDKQEIKLWLYSIEQVEVLEKAKND